MDSFINLLVAAVLAGTPLLFGTLGEILTEKSGNLNLGVEGLMFMGGVAGLAARIITNAPQRSRRDCWRSSSLWSAPLSAVPSARLFSAC